MSANKKTAVIGTIFLSMALGIAGLSALSDEKSHPASEGRAWLESKGYTNIEGGAYVGALKAGCAPLAVGREYRAVNPEGKIVNKTVCLSIFKPRFSLSR